MLSTVSLTLLVSIALYAMKIYLQFARNLAAAKKSGIPYFIVPFYVQNRLWQLSQAFVTPVLRMFPSSWTEPWLELIQLEWGWQRRYEPFKRLGTDTFLAVSSQRNMLFTADADVISQMTSRRTDFPKAFEVYDSLRIYGNNVVTSDGQMWRNHRKIISPQFSETNNHFVWTETLEQCQAMVNGWFDGNTAKIGSKTIRTLKEDTMRLSLYVISRAGFGVQLQWPTSEDARANGDVKVKQENGASNLEKSRGHAMSYTDALGSILHNVLWVLILPPHILSKYSTACVEVSADSVRTSAVPKDKGGVHILH